MGKNTPVGSASVVLEAEESTVAPGLDRLQSARQQPVDEAEDGPWIIWYLHPWYNEWWSEMYRTYQSAIIRWRETGGYLCKNHTPV